MKTTAPYPILYKRSKQKFSNSVNSPGQSIIEIVLAIGISALVISALVVLGSISLKNSLSSARRNEATKLAVSGLEAVRFLRDSEGFSTLTMGCYQIEPDGQVNNIDDACVATDGWVSIDLTESSSRAIFERKIEVEAYGNASEQSRMRKVTTTVRWAEGSTVDPATEGERIVVMSVVLSEWE